MAEKQDQSSAAAWDKLKALLDDAMSEEDPNAPWLVTLRTGTPSEVRDYLGENYDLSADELTDLITQFERVADRNSVGFWSPIG